LGHFVSIKANLRQSWLSSQISQAVFFGMPTLNKPNELIENVLAHRLLLIANCCDPELAEGDDSREAGPGKGTG